MNDAYWMNRALMLSAKANNLVNPNPKVGCVIVKNNRVVGEGLHHFFGGPHAEIEALKKAGKKARNSTAYVTLEPCVHEDKKTPPCVPALVRAGVKKVIIAIEDPNHKVRGRGIKALRSAGIQVKVGVLSKEALKLNRPFFTWLRGRPYVVLKMACSLDGKITSSKKWISNKMARHFAQKLRTQADAILVGVNTIIADDPRLSCRLNDAKQPLRVILDSRLRAPLSARVFNNPNALVATTQRAPPRKIRALKTKGVQVLFAKSLKTVLRELAKRNVACLLVEGGSQVASSFLRERFVDKAYFFVAPLIVGKGIPVLEGVEEQRFEHVKIHLTGDNALFEFDVQ